MSPAFGPQKEGRWGSQRIEEVFVHTMAFHTGNYAESSASAC